MVLFTLVLLLPAPAFASIPKVDLPTGDQAFLLRAAPEKARFALKTYASVVDQTQRKDPEALWRESMACYFVGLRLTSDSHEKERIFAQGRDAGLQAIALKPDCAECHFWTAINMALYGDTVGVFKMLFSLQEIEDHLKTTLRLNPAYANGGAYRVLGLIEQKLPGILGGSNAAAKEDFEKAIAIAPSEPLNYLFLAQLTHDEFHESSLASKIAQSGLAISEIAPDRLESLEAQQQLRELAKKWASPK